MKNYIIIGTGGHGRTVLGYLVRSGEKREQVAFVDLFEKRSETFAGCPVIGGLKSGIDSSFKEAGLIVAYGGDAYTGNKEREKASMETSRLLGEKYEFVTVVDPSAILLDDTQVSENVTIGIEAMIGPNSVVQEGVIVNNNVMVEHDVEIGAYSCISPGAIVLGGVKIGKRVFVGAGAILRDDITVGNNAIVGMGAVVTKDVAEKTFVAGNPAYLIRTL